MSLLASLVAAASHLFKNHSKKHTASPQQHCEEGCRAIQRLHVGPLLIDEECMAVTCGEGEKTVLIAVAHTDFLEHLAVRIPATETEQDRAVCKFTDGLTIPEDWGDAYEIERDSDSIPGLMARALRPIVQHLAGLSPSPELAA